MTPAAAALHVAVFRSIETTSVLNNCVVKAAHGEQARRDVELDRAISNAEYLLECLRTVRQQLAAEAKKASTL